MLNFCEDRYLEKHNNNYNSIIVSNFTKKLNIFIQNFYIYITESKDSKENYISFAKHIVQNYFSIIFGGLGRILEKSK